VITAISNGVKGKNSHGENNKNNSIRVSLKTEKIPGNIPQILQILSLTSIK
jgi:hypothetical protein